MLRPAAGTGPRRRFAGGRLYPLRPRGAHLLELRRNAITLEDLFLQLTADDAQQTLPEKEPAPDTPEEADGETEEDLP